MSCSAPPCGAVFPTSTLSGVPTTYSAPANASARNLIVIITATSVADTSQSAKGTITVPKSSAITVTVNLASVTLAPGGGLDISATVLNDASNSGVAWAISPATEGGTLASMKSASGTLDLYTAPAILSSTSLSVTITATSLADSTKSAVIAVTVTTAIFVTVSPSQSLIQVNGTSPFSAVVTNDPNSAGVTWSIGGCVGSASVCGSITNINNSGSFTADYVAPATVPTGGQVNVVATSMAAGDLNGDGKTDLAITTFACAFGLCSGVTSALFGNGDGTFQPVQNIWGAKSLGTNIFPLSIEMVDLTGDGKADLLEISSPPRGSPSLVVLHGNGDGTFQGPLFFGVDQNPYALAVGDLNGDGKPDIVVANQGSNDITILLNATGP